MVGAGARNGYKTTPHRFKSDSHHQPQFFRFFCGTAYGLLSDEEKRHPRKRRRSPEHVRDSGAPSWEAWLWGTCACSLMAEPQTSNLMVGVRFSSRTPRGHYGGPRESFEVPKALVKRYIRPSAQSVGSASTTDCEFN